MEKCKEKGSKRSYSDRWFDFVEERGKREREEFIEKNRREFYRLCEVVCPEYLSKIPHRNIEIMLRLVSSDGRIDFSKLRAQTEKFFADNPGGKNIEYALDEKNEDYRKKAGELLKKETGIELPANGFMPLYLYSVILERCLKGGDKE